MGFIVKKTLNKIVSSIPKISIVSIQLDKYHGGWFSSQAILSLKMHVPAQKTTDKNGITRMQLPVDLEMDIPITIKHGPFIVADNGIRFGLGMVTTQPETHYGVLINYFNKVV